MLIIGGHTFAKENYIPSDVVDTEYENAYEVLTGLSVFDYNTDSSFRPLTPITRGDFAVALGNCERRSVQKTFVNESKFFVIIFFITNDFFGNFNKCFGERQQNNGCEHVKNTMTKSNLHRINRRINKSKFKTYTPFTLG